MLILHVWKVHDIVKKELFRTFGRNAGNALIWSVHDYFFEFTDFGVYVDAAVRVHKFWW